jgi:hypothetical protein
MELSDWHRWWKSSGHRELYRLLLLWWDPVDVKNVPEAHGEYTGYAGRIGWLLRESGRKADLAELLGDAEGHMGLAGNDELNELVASKIVNWYAEAMRET